MECSYPIIHGGRVRRDMPAECGHYARWREDLRLVKALGVNTLRQGLPLHRIVGRDGARDWSFADEVMAEMRTLDYRQIVENFGRISATPLAELLAVTDRSARLRVEV